MAWNISFNVHVQIWIARPINVLPVGPPDLDVQGQLLTPGKPAFAQPQAWGPRLVIDPAPFLASTVLAFLGDMSATATYAQLIDDNAAVGVGWWQVIDVSLSTRPGLVVGQHMIDAAFLMLQSTISF